MTDITQEQAVAMLDTYIAMTLKRHQDIGKALDAIDEQLAALRQLLHLQTE